MQTESAEKANMPTADVLKSAHRIALATIVAAVTSACSSLSGPTTGNSLAAAETAPEPEKKTEYRAIPAPTMYSLLIAEMAGQRQRFDVALYHYLDQARKTRDPNVAERALRIAQYVGAGAFAKEASDIWISVEPNDPSAIQAAAQVALGQGEYDRSLELYARFFDLTGIPQFDFYAAATLSKDESVRKDTLSRLEALNMRYPKEGNLLYGQALMLQSFNDLENAVTRIDQALRLSPDLLPAAIQKARILARMNKVDEAIDWLDDVLDDHPDNKQVAVLRARMMLQNEDPEGARDAFIDINERFPNDGQIVLSLALLEEELGNYEEAKDLLLTLLSTGEQENEAYFYLGRIATAEENPDLAVQYYRQIGESREFMAGQLAAALILNEEQGSDAAVAYLQERASVLPQYSGQLRRIEADILIKADRIEEAFSTVSSALENSPEDIDLIYTRAMLAERLGNLELLESDLRFLISLKPDHAEALNALGYSLANKTDRYAEAEPLIEKALSLQPDNPAIIDSLGWLYFREGKVNDAGPLLQDAWQRMKDHEIAAHLGEWYWTTGNQEAALDVWRAGLETNPDSEIIEETLKRLGVDQNQL
ncbi:MAG: tetratricopeptide repeat protein [Thalassolituus sp.]